MGLPLGDAEFNILQSHVSAGDRIAYYSQLEDWGYDYGGLALGVVNNDSISGIAANVYFLLNAAEEGKPIVADLLTTISLRLMQLDLVARRQFDGSENGEDLPVSTIQAYHALVFGNEAGVSADAWTPNIALNSLATVEEREALWDDLIEASFIEPISPVIDYLQILAAVGGSDNEYLRDLEVSGITAGLIVAADAVDLPLVDLGDTSSSIAIGNGGYIISGKASDDPALYGSMNNDVLLGFDGNDVLFGGDGNDRLYGGEGVDYINGGKGDDIIGIEEPDGDADIIAVGQGFDWITGKGEAEDRLVLPSEILTAPSSLPVSPGEVLPNFTSNGSGASNDKGIPLLGGALFTTDGNWRLPTFINSSGDVEKNFEYGSLEPGTALFADYSYTGSFPEEILPGDPENPEEDPDIIIPEQFVGLVTFMVTYFTFENFLVSNPDEVAHYNQLGYVNNPNSLFIEISIIQGGDDPVEKSYVLIENFTNGDFGINLINNAPTVSDAQTLSNNGEYETITITPSELIPDLDTGAQLLNNPRIIGDQFANLLEGDERDNTIVGRGDDDELIGKEGNDILFAGSGNDILNGGIGDDRLVGGTGADNILGGEGIDTAVYTQSVSGVSVNLSTGSAAGGDAQGDTISEVENLVGSGFNDNLIGNSADNRLVGDAGDDSLSGEGGNDRLIGGEGADAITGGDGIDTAVYSQSATAVTVNLSTNSGSSGDATGDTLFEVENLVGSGFGDSLTGDIQNNRLVGRDGNDILFGDGGNDRLIGGEGDDQLTGGIGNDVFIFDGNFGSDIITDFEAGDLGNDRIKIQSPDISSFDDLLNLATEENDGVMITLTEGTIFLENTLIDDLNQGDFIL